MTPRDIRSRNWSEDYPDRTMRPCSSCHVEYDNQKLRKRISRAVNAIERLQSELAHWEAWQRAVTPLANLKDAINRAIQESVGLTFLVFGVVGLALYGAGDMLCTVITALQQVMK